MKSVPLSGKRGQGKFALVDDEDYDLVSQWKWHIDRHGYARRTITIAKYKEKSISMHRVITNCPEGLCVDHINHNPLDNQRSNLRICTFRENRWNQKKRKDSKRDYIGVKQLDGRWYASIMVKRKRISLGGYASEIEAAKAYDAAAKQYRGEFAKLNFE